MGGLDRPHNRTRAAIAVTARIATQAWFSRCRKGDSTRWATPASVPREPVSAGGELLADRSGCGAELLLGYRGEVLADDGHRTARERLLRELAADHGVVERVTFGVGRQVEVEMVDVTAEDVHVDELGADDLLERGGDRADHCPEGPGLVAVECRDVGDVTLRFQEREPSCGLARM